MSDKIFGYKPDVTIKKGAWTFLIVGLLALAHQFISEGYVTADPAVLGLVLGLLKMGQNYVKHKDD